MSRVGKNPVAVPANVEVALSTNEVSVKGPLGTLHRTLVSDIRVEREGDSLLIKPSGYSYSKNRSSVLTCYPGAIKKHIRQMRSSGLQIQLILISRQTVIISAAKKHLQDRKEEIP